MDLNLTGFSYHQASSSTYADVSTTKTSFLDIQLIFLTFFLFRALTPILRSIERRSTAIYRKIFLIQICLIFSMKMHHLQYKRH